HGDGGRRHLQLHPAVVLRAFAPGGGAQPLLPLPAAHGPLRRRRDDPARQGVPPRRRPPGPPHRPDLRLRLPGLRPPPPAPSAPPADLTKTYLFSIEHAPGAPGTNDFYVAFVGGGVSNFVETNESGNDMLSGAETPPMATQTGTHYYVDGDIVTDTDVDWW